MSGTESTTAIERRLEAALHARADQVRPEDLDVFEPPVPPAVDHPRRWRVTTYAAAAAACAAAVVAAYVLQHRAPSAPEPAPVPTPPDGWVGGEGRTGPGADLPGSRLVADVDGDGAADSVWVRSALDGTSGPVRVEALLSSRPDQVVWTLLGERAGAGSQEAGLQLDEDPGDELVVRLDNDTSTTLVVVDLVDGRLQEVPADRAAGAALTSKSFADGRRRVPRVVDGRLLTWQSQEPVGESQQFVRGDVTWWRIGGADDARRVVAADTGVECFDMFDGRQGPCLAGDQPDAEGPDMEGDNPDDFVPAYLPVVTGRLDPGKDLVFDVEGASATARLTGPAEQPVLEVSVGADTLTAELGPGEPARLVDGVVPGTSGPVLLVDRGATWSPYAVRGGALVDLYVSDEAPFGTGDGHHTELGESGLLWTAQPGGTGDPEVQRVWLWSVDDGPGLVADDKSCFRFPGDGSDPTFAAC